MRFPAFPLLIVLILLFVGFARCLKLTIFPGTKWCGIGNISKISDDLGFHAVTDKCCRDHDSCNKTIEARHTRYGLHNYDIFTKSHCSCDRKFYDCLKATPKTHLQNYLVSRLIGKKYFDLLAPQCFKFKYPAKCVKKGWLFGRCTKYTYDKSGKRKYQWFDNKGFLCPKC